MAGLKIAALVTAIAVAIIGIVCWRIAARRRPALAVRLRVAAPTAAAAPDVLVVRPGDEVTVEAIGATAVWVFRGDEVVAACPGPRCLQRGEKSTLSFAPGSGRHRVVAVRAFAAGVPADGFDASVLRARALGADLDLRSIDVAAPP